MSERQACKLAGMAISSYRYQARCAQRDEALKARLTALAQQYPRFGSAICLTRGARSKPGAATEARTGRIAALRIEHRKSSQRLVALRINSVLGRDQGSQTPTPCPPPPSPLKPGL
jgi:hypothetical protein